MYQSNRLCRMIRIGTVVVGQVSDWWRSCQVRHSGPVVLESRSRGSVTLRLMDFLAMVRSSAPMPL